MTVTTDPFIRSPETKINGRILRSRETEVSIQGERGRFLFIEEVTNPRTDATWITVVGGPKGVYQWRSFDPDRIRTVHRLTKRRQPPAGISAPRRRRRK